MTVNIDGYQVTISAKFTRGGVTRNNKRDTLAILNLLAIYAGEASDSFDKKGVGCLGKIASEIRSELYNTCEANGLYKDLVK